LRAGDAYLEGTGTGHRCSLAGSGTHHFHVRHMQKLLQLLLASTHRMPMNHVEDDASRSAGSGSIPQPCLNPVSSKLEFDSRSGRIPQPCLNPVSSKLEFAYRCPHYFGSDALVDFSLLLLVLDTLRVLVPVSRRGVCVRVGVSVMMRGSLGLFHSDTVVTPIEPPSRNAC